MKTKSFPFYTRLKLYEQKSIVNPYSKFMLVVSTQKVGITRPDQARVFFSGEERAWELAIGWLSNGCYEGHVTVQSLYSVNEAWDYKIPHVAWKKTWM